MKKMTPPIPEDSSIRKVLNTFWPQTEINPDLWDVYMPYQLVLLTAGDDGVSYEPTGDRFTLPISPQELSIDMPVASQVLATLGGVSITHGGAPFRNITLQGTTGIAPKKKRAEMLGTTPLPNAIFAGTVQAAQQAIAVGKAFGDGRQSTDSTRSTNTHVSIKRAQQLSPTDTDFLEAESTGYYQMRLMEQFIEAYITLKSRTRKEKDSISDPTLSMSNEDRKKLRMALCVWKDEACYLVEPIQFTKRRSASNPMEYTFSLTLRAWRRISAPKTSYGSSLATPYLRDPNKLAQAYSRFRTATGLINAARKTLETAVHEPFNRMTEALREVGLFLASIQNFANAVVHLPDTIKAEINGLVKDDWGRLREQLGHGLTPETDFALRSGAKLTAEQDEEFDRLVTSAIGLESVRPGPALRAKIEAEQARVMRFGRADFERRRDIAQRAAADFADRVGAGHALFTSTYNRPAPSIAPTRVPTDEEMDVLFALNEACIVLDQLASSTNINPITPTSVEYVAGLAEQSGVAFQVPRSKFAVPFPYGSTLERLALQYLGDANRWHEIATLNGLRAPYIDETGFQLPLLANGDRNTVVVSNARNLYQGQTVWLSADGARREKRRVTRIESQAASQHTITLSGEADLNRFTTMLNAKLEAFLPGTVNSQQVIYIPSDEEAAEDPRTKAVPGVDAFDPLLSVSGIDLMLSPDGDLVITPDGDCRVAYGLANIVQTVRLMLTTPKGALLQHPEFGLPLEVGQSTADVDANELLKLARAAFERDPMFSGVRAAQVVKDGPVLRLTLDIGIAGTSQFVPITVAVR